MYVKFILGTILTIIFVFLVKCESQNDTLETTTAESEPIEVLTTNSTLSEFESNQTSSESSAPETNKPTESTAETTTTKSTTTTPPIPVFNRTQFAYGHYCTCDLTEGSCDVNCCCDADCSESDVNVFSECLPAETYRPDPRFCFQTEVVVENNTQFLVEKTSPEDLFCIITDNLVNGFRFQERDQVDNLTDFLELTSRHKTYVQPDDRTFEVQRTNETEELEIEIEEVSVDFDDKFYYIGKPIWTYRRDLKTPGIFALPAKHDCGQISPVRYGHDEVVECHRGPIATCEDMAFLSASEFFDFSFVRSPGHYRNKTDPLVEMSVRVCATTLVSQRCHDMHENGPIHKATPGCDNIVTSAHYVILHDGIKGIKSVAVTIELRNYSSILGSESLSVLSQRFSYTHYWSTDNATEVNKRSGNPGYQRGKPILSGNLVKNETGASWYIQREPKPFLTIMKTDPDCLQIKSEDQLEVEFGENVKTGCSFNVGRLQLSDDCDSLKNQVVALLLGLRQDDIAQATKSRAGWNLNNKLESRRIAVFGNTESGKPGDWIQILYSNLPTLSATPSKSSKTVDGVCRNFVNSLHIEIAYARTGSVANPQSKIVGVHYRFGRPEDLIFRCLGLACRHPALKSLRIEVSTSVAFLDVSEPALVRYAEYPVIEARLPHDFFYPFITTSEASFLQSRYFIYVFVTLFVVCL